MTIKRLVIWITFLAVFAMAARISMDTDSWWHLRTGAWILENGRVPDTDPFSYTRFGEEWRAPGWIVQVPMVWMYRTGGPGLLNLWVAAMVTLAFGLVYRALEGGVFTRAFIIVLAASAAGVYWAARPYMLTFVLSAAFLWILEDWRFERKDRLWWLPAMMVVWANGHGGFVVGLVLYGVYLVGNMGRWAIGRSAAFRAVEVDLEHGRGEVEGELADGRGAAFRAAGGPMEGKGEKAAGLRKMLLVGALLVAAVALNPAGPELLLYPFKTVGIEALQEYIQEWQSPDFHQRQVWPFAAMIFLILGAVGVSGRRLALEDFLLAAGWGFMGLLAGRNIATFALAGAVVLSRHAAPVLDRWGAAMGVRLKPERRPGRAMGVLNAALVVLVAVAAGVKALSVYPEAVNRAAFAEFLPLGAVEYIKAEMPEGFLFNSYNWGSYLLWELPEYPVFIDGRTDLFNNAIINDWFSVIRYETGWEQTLEYWNVNIVLIEPQIPLAGLLEADWTVVYRDTLSVVFLRSK